jgi:hypothetical protein
MLLAALFCIAVTASHEKRSDYFKGFVDEELGGEAAVARTLASLGKCSATDSCDLPRSDRTRVNEMQHLAIETGVVGDAKTSEAYVVKLAQQRVAHGAAKSWSVLKENWQTAQAKKDNSGQSDKPPSESAALDDDSIHTWLKSINPILLKYADALAEYGYGNTGVLVEAEKADLEEAFEEIKIKKPHRRLLHKAAAKIMLPSS